MAIGTGVELILAERSYPAFGAGRSSYYTNYPRIAADGIDRITGELVIQQTDPSDPHLWLDLYFAERSYDCSVYGLPYGDEQLEESVTRALQEVLGCSEIGTITYTEQGMQTDDHVSLETYGPLVDVINRTSAHEILRISRGRSAIVHLANARGTWIAPSSRDHG